MMHRLKHSMYKVEHSIFLSNLQSNVFRESKQPLQVYEPKAIFEGTRVVFGVGALLMWFCRISHLPNIIGKSNSLQGW